VAQVSASTETKSSGRLALVTGAARRIGAAIARELHARGCTVVIHHFQSAAAAAQLAGELNGLRPASAHLAPADLTSQAGPEALARRVAELGDRLDLLVNNASRFYATPVGEVSYATWKDLMGSNVRGAFFLTQALLPMLQGGAVVNILDIHGRRPMSKHPVYSMAKAALEMMTLSLARDLAPGVRVNGVAPGAILWPDEAPVESVKSTILARVAMGRLGSPEDIAAAVAFLGLDAPYVTGQVLAVDGGRSLYM